MECLLAKILISLFHILLFHIIWIAIPYLNVLRVISIVQLMQNVILIVVECIAVQEQIFIVNRIRIVILNAKALQVMRVIEQIYIHPL